MHLSFCRDHSDLFFCFSDGLGLTSSKLKGFSCFSNISTTVMFNVCLRARVTLDEVSKQVLAKHCLNRLITLEALLLGFNLSLLSVDSLFAVLL